MSRPRRPAPGLTREERLDSLLADIDALPVSRRNERAGAVNVQTDFLLSPYSAVRAAAGLRRLSVQSYVRRATYALVAADLGIPITDLLSRDDRVARENGFGVSDPEGTKFGSWDVEVRGGAER